MSSHPHAQLDCVPCKECQGTGRVLEGKNKPLMAAEEQGSIMLVFGAIAFTGFMGFGVGFFGSLSLTMIITLLIIPLLIRRLYTVVAPKRGKSK